MMTKRVLLGGVCAASLIVAGCEQVSNKEGGTLGGAAVGAAVGSVVGDGAGNVIATAGGAVVGGVIGREIGKYLDEQDQKKMAESTASTAATGESRSWDNPDSGVSGTTEVVESKKKREQVSVPVKKDRVEEVPPLELIGEPYQATSDVNVRGGPSTEYKQVGLVSNGETVRVAGKVEGKSWYMISRDGAGSGFVHRDYFNPADNKKMADSPDQQPAGENVATASVEAERECRTVEQTVTLKDGETRTDTVEACKGPNGWVVQG